METCIVNLLEPGQKLLSLAHGYWGHRVASIGKRLGFSTRTLLPSMIGENFTLEEIEECLKKYGPHLMYVCHGDSSICCLQPLDRIGNLCHKYDCLLIVDAVVSLCSTYLSMDELEIDVLYSGGQKALSGPPGISLISFSERAIRTIKQRSKPISSFYMDIELIGKSWAMENNNVHTYHYTPAINLMYGLRASILEIIREGLPNVIQRHQQTQQYLEKQLQEIGLELLIKNHRNRLPGITAVLIPDDIDGNIVIQFMYNKYGILIGGSLLADDKTIPKFWRIGYLGVNAQIQNIDKLIKALNEAIKHQRCLKPHL